MVEEWKIGDRKKTKKVFWNYWVFFFFFEEKVREYPYNYIQMTVLKKLKAGPPLEAILVIFGLRALIFFVVV